MTKIEKVLEKFRNEIYWIATTGQPFTVAEKINIEKDAFKKVAQEILVLIPKDIAIPDIPIYSPTEWVDCG